MLNILTATILLLIVFSTPLFAQDKRPDEFPVVSYRKLEVKEFNMQITAAEKKQDEWVFNPLSIAHNRPDGCLLPCCFDSHV